VAGWWLGGGGNHAALPFLFAGATFLYLGGTFLNDAFDAQYDREYRRGRPIASSALTSDAVRRWGVAWLGLGVLSLFWVGAVAGGLALVLAGSIFLYNAIHRVVIFSPLLLGFCRFLLYLIAASTALDGATGWAIWCGLALAAYVTGVGYIARWEKGREPATHWPLVLLAVPILLALLMDTGGYRESGLLLSAILALWTLRCLRPTLWSPERAVDLTASGLAAGIVFVDCLAAADAPRIITGIFIGLFLVTLALQRLGSGA
jgi:4-hydroxybenzoate polyprenyltransferase